MLVNCSSEIMSSQNALMQANVIPMKRLITIRRANAVDGKPPPTCLREAGDDSEDVPLETCALLPAGDNDRSYEAALSEYLWDR